MLLVRFVGQHAARQAVGKSGSAKHKDQKAPQVELFIEANEHGRRRVTAPITGSADFAKLDAPSWGVFGLVWGLIVGFAGGDGGVLGPLRAGSSPASSGASSAPSPALSTACGPGAGYPPGG